MYYPIYTFIAVLLAFAAGCKGSADGTKLKLPSQPTTQTESVPQPVITGPESTKPAAEAQDPGTPAQPAPAGTVRLTGSTAPHRSSAIAVNGSGLLEQMLVQEGDLIKAGQIIARLDRSDSVLRVRQAQTALAGARVSLTAAQRERNRLARLDQGSAVSQAAIDSAQTALEGAQTGVAAAEVALAMAVDANRNRTVHAPYAGLVVARLKAEGEWITTMPPSPVIQLAEISPLDLQIDAPENLLTRISVGDEVTARFTSINLTVETRVSRIVPIVQAGNRSFKVIAEIPNKDLSIQPGVFAEVEIAPGADRAADKAGSQARPHRTTR